MADIASSIGSDAELEGDREQVVPTVKKRRHHWTIEDELTLSSQLLEDLRGVQCPPKKGGCFWEELRKCVGAKLDLDCSKDQIHDKYRRMKVKYQKMVEDDSKIHRYRDSNEETLFHIWRQILQDEVIIKVGNEGIPKPIKEFQSILMTCSTPMVEALTTNLFGDLHQYEFHSMGGLLSEDHLLLSEFEQRWLEQQSQELGIIAKRLELQQKLLHYQMKLLGDKNTFCQSV